jgi:putative ABC transport system substrate-binding protein
MLAVPFMTQAQTSTKLPRVGWLGNMAPPPPPVGPLEGFREGLREAGYVEGQNMVIEYRWAEGKLDRLPALALELADLKVEVLMVAGTQGS